MQLNIFLSLQTVQHQNSQDSELKVIIKSVSFPDRVIGFQVLQVKKEGLPDWCDRKTIVTGESRTGFAYKQMHRKSRH